MQSGRGWRSGAISATISLAALLTGACGTQATRGYPLYARVGDGPGPDKVALLQGPVQSVDGQSVAAQGQTFELLPGCHIVTLQRNIGAGTASGAWAANFGYLVVPFEMKPGHRYLISADFEDTSAPVGHAQVMARERAPDGSTIRVPFARSNEDIRACRRWAQSQRF
jgi:hypothetical protein